jgi:hypothetical protein
MAEIDIAQIKSMLTAAKEAGGPYPRLAEIDVAQIKSMLTAAKEARGPDPRLVVPSRKQLSATLRDMQKLLPLLEKAGLDVGALEKIAKEDEAHEDRKAHRRRRQTTRLDEEDPHQKHEGAGRWTPRRSLCASCPARPTRHRDNTALFYLGSAGRYTHAIEHGSRRQLGKRVP